MKSFEKHLSEKCPAILEWHKKRWEESLKTPATDEVPQSSKEEKNIQSKPVITEWKTIYGNMRINQNFVKNMTVGYYD